MIRLAVVGATGRTGSRVIELARRQSSFQIVAGLTSGSDPRLGKPAWSAEGAVRLSAETEAKFDVLVDFSLPPATMHWLERCVKRGCALVSGTTGLSEKQRQTLHQAAERIPVLWASNFSVGINLLLRYAGPVARELGADFDIEIVETHHRRKVDAPSGTALSLARAMVGATGRNFDDDVVHGRSGIVGPRPAGQIGIHAVRLGDEIGRHEIHFASAGETVVLQHTARSRHAFASGALAAARWMVGRQPGLYSMQDVLAAAT